MLSRKLALATIFTLALSISIAAHNREPARIYKMSRTDFLKYRSQLTKLNADITGVDVKNNQVYIYLTPQTSNLVGELGAKLTLAEAQPRNPDSKFKTPEQIAKIVKGWQTSYPELVQLESIGKSLEGRDIWAVKITSPNSGKSKPAVLFNAMHHAREVMGPEAVLDIGEQLLTGATSNDQVKKWLASYDIYLIPMFNVDGNNMVWTADTMWRKNTRGGFGVDINRNYPYGWNSCQGSSDSTGAQDYHGTGPASEPETNVMMDFVKRIHPVFDISFHSYSELVLYPYGCGEHTTTKDIVEPIGQKMAELIVADDGQGHYTAGTPPELLYNADGGDIDWMYHEAHVIPYVIELNAPRQGFQPSYDQWRDTTISRVRPAWQYLLERMQGSALQASLVSIESTSATTVVVTATSTWATQTGFSDELPLEGRTNFFMILNPGHYKAQVKQGAKVILEKEFEISNDIKNLQL